MKGGLWGVERGVLQRLGGGRCEVRSSAVAAPHRAPPHAPAASPTGPGPFGTPPPFPHLRPLLVSAEARQQLRVVGDDNHAAPKFLHRVAQRVDGLHVQVVCLVWWG